MSAWHFLVLSAGKPHAHKIPPFGGGCWGFLERGGGWKCQFYFMGAGIFPNLGFEMFFKIEPMENK